MGVGYYILRDMNYGVTLGLLAGGVVGAIIWADGGRGKDFLRGMAFGTVIGAGTGLILGIIEGSLRVHSHRHAEAERGVSFSLGFMPGRAGAPPTPFPSLSGRF
jgi:hypothetical protein